MSADVHPRIRARRRQVREDGAHRRLRWVLAVMLAVGLAGLGYWLLQSPLLAVDRILVHGDVERSVVTARAAGAGLEVGAPIAFVRQGAVAEAIAADPLVADVRVEVRYPHEVAILVAGHRPLAWVDTGEGWLHVTAEGHVVAATAEPAAGPVLVAPGAAASPGEALGDPAALAGLRFVAGLPEGVAAVTRVSVLDGVLAATVADHAVTLGAPLRMADKAAAVAALTPVLDVPSAIDVSAPDRPAAAPLAADPPPPADDTEASVEGEG